MEYRRLAASQPGSILLETTRELPGKRARSFFFSEPVEWLQVRRLGDLPHLFARLQAAKTAGLWAAGYLSYECGYHWEPTAAPGFEPATGGLPLAAFGLYRQPVPFAGGARYTGLGRGVDDFSFAIAPEAFTEKVAAIQKWIETGDTYQVNLTNRIRADFRADFRAGFCARFRGSPDELFTHIMETQPVEFGALLRVGEQCIVSASPELFFELKGRNITVRPMKGTAPRGRDAAEDAARAAALAADEKNRAENIMIVDLLRSDLGRVAEMGSVQVRKLFTVEQFPSLLQMSSEITAELRPDIDMYALFGSLFPSGSIVGAPKVRTMQLLRELESRERGVYTGAIGFMAPSGEAVFSVAIRTAVLEGERLEMGVGAGITYDSHAAAEYAECLLKAEFLRERPFGLIETMRWKGGCCPLLGRHMDRLGASAAYFGFRFEPERILQALAAHTAGLAGESAWKVRMVLDRAGVPVFSPVEQLGEDAEPLRVLLWPEPVDSEDRFLRHKTTRRALYDKALGEARKAGCVDALFRNKRGMLTEGTIHNVFVRHGSRWRTPPLDAGVLPGVYRAHVLATMPQVEEREITMRELLNAEEIRLTNAVRGIRVIERVVPRDSSQMRRQRMLS